MKGGMLYDFLHSIKRNNFFRKRFYYVKLYDIIIVLMTAYIRALRYKFGGKNGF